MLSLEIDGIDYTGWTDVAVSRTITSITGTFSLGLTDRFRFDDKPPITPGKPFQILRNGVLIKTGFIDAILPSFNSDGVLFLITGRDKTMDIADCPVTTASGEWKNLSFEELVRELVKPFNLNVVVKVPTGDKIATVNHDQGTRVFELIRKEAEKKQLLIYADFNSDIVIDQVSDDESEIALVEGENIIEGSGNLDFSEIFSKYIVKGDQQSLSVFNTEDETQANAEFEDGTIGRFRPLIINQEGSTDNGKAIKRATWEATTRLALKESYEITVQGWFPDINKLITVNSETLGLDNVQLLIAGVNLSINVGGEKTTFQLVPKEAFAPIPTELLKTEEKSKYFSD